MSEYEIVTTGIAGAKLKKGEMVRIDKEGYVWPVLAVRSDWEVIEKLAAGKYRDRGVSLGPTHLQILASAILELLDRMNIQVSELYCKPEAAADED